jgi:hypothetical protein
VLGLGLAFGTLWSMAHRPYDEGVPSSVGKSCFKPQSTQHQQSEGIQMRVISTLLMMAICALCLPSARAQILNFTNDSSLTNGPKADKGLLKDRPDAVHFPAGSAVWAVLYVPTAGFADINEFSGKPQGGGALRKTVEMANLSGGWNILSSELLDVPANLGTGKSIVLPIIPDKPDSTQPFNLLLDMISAHKGPTPILMRVKIESGENPRQYSQNGFYLDISDGLGRYGEWLTQRGAAINTANDAFEQQHLRPRSAFVANYRSLRSDPKFVADVRRWWSDKVGGPLLSVKVCSDNYILFRDNIGLVTDKQLCALITYKSGAKCFAMMRRFSYPRVGRETFASEVEDATYANQSLTADEGENFSGAHPYEIECSAPK